MPRRSLEFNCVVSKFLIEHEDQKIAALIILALTVMTDHMKYYVICQTFSLFPLAMSVYFVVKFTHNNIANAYHCNDLTNPSVH